MFQSSVPTRICSQHSVAQPGNNFPSHALCTDQTAYITSPLSVPQNHTIYPGAIKRRRISDGRNAGTGFKTVQSGTFIAALLGSNGQGSDKNKTHHPAGNRFDFHLAHYSGVSLPDTAGPGVPAVPIKPPQLANLDQNRPSPTPRPLPSRPLEVWPSPLAFRTPPPSEHSGQLLPPPAQLSAIVVETSWAHRFLAHNHSLYPSAGVAAVTAAATAAAAGIAATAVASDTLATSLRQALIAASRDQIMWTAAGLRAAGFSHSISGARPVEMFVPGPGWSRGVAREVCTGGTAC